jgi:molecular chaperone DnaJ
MKIPPGTQSGTDFKLSSHGVPHINQSSRSTSSGQARGPHIVTITVETPTKLTKDQRTLLEQFKKSDKKGFWR